MEHLYQFMQVVLNYLRLIHVTDFIDIGIMAFIIYRVIILIRRSSSGQVAKGVVLILAALWLSQLLKLNTVNYFLGKTVEWGVLALVVLFQPEIRKMLEQVGNRCV